jgi:hypothetical protein
VALGKIIDLMELEYTYDGRSHLKTNDALTSLSGKGPLQAREITIIFPFTRYRGRGESDKVMSQILCDFRGIYHSFV